VNAPDHPLSCALCGRDWAPWTDWKSEDPLWTWVSKDKSVTWCGLVCAGSCAEKCQRRFRADAFDYCDLHLSWFAGEDASVALSSEILTIGAKWSEEYTRSLVRFAMRAALLGMDAGRASKRKSGDAF
jgi:hypothetical protein